MDVFHCPPGELAQRLTYRDFLEVMIYMDLREQKDGKGFELDPKDLLAQMVEQYGHLLPSHQNQK